eukprot:snap_masked-scaffold_6-processed-gene-6.35-mRNA-1 protein AED:0.46 eAED:0.46 QI:0/-1/0/1/-1/1/1/0/869
MNINSAGEKKKVVGVLYTSGEDRPEEIVGGSEWLNQLIKIFLTRNIAEPFLRCKLLVVGKARAGKTSLIKQLLGKDFDEAEDSTKGCDLVISRVKKILSEEFWEEKIPEEDEQFLSFLHKLYESSNIRIIYQKNRRHELIPPPTFNLKEQEINDITARFEEYLEGENDLARDDLSFSIWDFGGQEVFYSLHHLFMTEYGCYLIIFNAENILNDVDGSQSSQIAFLKFWLNSKKLHARSAPLILVGTHCEGFTKVEYKQVHYIIEEAIMQETGFKNERFEGADLFGVAVVGCFFPVDNKTGFGVDLLRKSIEKVVRKQDFLSEEIKLAFLRAYDLFMKEKKNYLLIEDAKEIFRRNKLPLNQFEGAVDFLNQRGLITYFNQIYPEHNAIILEPQWLIDGITKIIYDKKVHDRPDIDAEFEDEFREYNRYGYMKEILINNIWEKAGYSDVEIKYLKTVMELTLLLCESGVRGNETTYLIPTLPDLEDSQNEPELSDEFCGPFFVIDFSGFGTESNNFVKYLPFGLFERLVCLAIKQNYELGGLKKPSIREQVATLSFGDGASFQMHPSSFSESTEKLCIKVRVHKEANFLEAREIIKNIYCMIKTIEETFFSNSNDESNHLLINLLLPSSEETGFILARYEDLIEKVKGNYNKKFFPSPNSNSRRCFNDYRHWFIQGNHFQEDSTENSLITPKNYTPGDLQRAQSMIYQFKPLPNNIKHHCFLSYRQEDSIDIVRNISFYLQIAGYKCWYDMDFDGNLGAKEMTQGVQDCMVYVLILSKNIFKSDFVTMEFSKAEESGKHIEFLSHPDTGRIGNVELGSIISAAPRKMQQMLDHKEILPIRRRYNEVESFKSVLFNRIGSVLERTLTKENI